MDTKKIKSVTDFDSKFVTAEGDSVYVRFDFGGFYEWYKFTDKTFSLLDVAASKELEESFEIYDSSRERNVIDLDGIRLKSNSKSSTKN